jgi:hypothetical protein
MASAFVTPASIINSGNIFGVVYDDDSFTLGIIFRQKPNPDNTRSNTSLNLYLYSDVGLDIPKEIYRLNGIADLNMSETERVEAHKSVGSWCAHNVYKNYPQKRYTFVAAQGSYHLLFKGPSGDEYAGISIKTDLPPNFIFPPDTISKQELEQFSTFISQNT